MEKPITYVGNSFGLLLDRTVCEVMGIGYGSIVKLTFDGNRLIVERTGKLKMPPPRATPRRAPMLRSRRVLKSVNDPRKPILVPDLDADGETPIERLASEHRGVVSQLMQSWDLTLERLNRIDYKRSVHFMEMHRRLMTLRVGSESPADLVVARRLSFIYVELLDRQDWDRVIVLACDRYPLPPSSDAMSAGSGADAVTRPPSG